MIFTEIDILLRLAAAYILSYFLIKPKLSFLKKASNERDIKFYLINAIIYSVLSYIILGIFSHVWIPLILFAAHFLFNFFRYYYKKRSVWIFISEQIFHLIVISLCWLIYTGQFSNFTNHTGELFNSNKFWYILTGYLIITTPLSVFISKVTGRWNEDLHQTADQSLKDAGKWIGIIERILILTFIIIGEFEIIGFLLAAKSVFRFGDLKNKEDRKRTEYILIGTLISFSFAIFIGLFIKMVI